MYNVRTGWRAAGVFPFHRKVFHGSDRREKDTPSPRERESERETNDNFTIFPVDEIAGPLFAEKSFLRPTRVRGSISRGGGRNTPRRCQNVLNIPWFCGRRQIRCGIIIRVLVTDLRPIRTALFKTFFFFFFKDQSLSLRLLRVTLKTARF